mmetsp:Transcript_115522/g.337957  ORF Transcript_115522/g.337957 Transcript_115522/m.337957 type:complete len:201 (+) Transcript_115522:1381-1983(+)
MVIRDDVLQPPALFMADASLKHRVEQDLLGANVDACPIQQCERFGHNLGLLHPLQRLHDNRDCVVVHGHAVALHQLNGLPGLLEVAAAVGDGGVHEAVVGDVVRLVPCPLHLAENVLGAFEVTARAVALHQRVVRDGVQRCDLLHLRNELARTLEVARADADIEDAVVGRDIQRHARVAQPRQQAEGPVDIFVTSGGTDE